jgi:hypothetical protein
MRQPFVVITGLPASGKSTLAQPLAEALGVECLSKDRIKEALFDGLGYGGWERSKTLSRAADAAMTRCQLILKTLFWTTSGTQRRSLTSCPRYRVQGSRCIAAAIRQLHSSGSCDGSATLGMPMPRTCRVERSSPSTRRCCL